MSVDDRLKAFFDGQMQVNRPVQVGTRLQGDGGGGTSGGGMEARIAKLESDMEHIKKAIDRLHDVPTKLAVIEERVSHLPTVGKLWAAVGATISSIGVIVALVVRFLPHAA